MALLFISVAAVLIISALCSLTEAALYAVRMPYVRTLDGPWLLYDNHNDPYELDNLVGKPQYADLQKELDAVLRRNLHESGDRFLPAAVYIEKWGYPVNETGTVPYTP